MHFRKGPRKPDIDLPLKPSMYFAFARTLIVSWSAVGCGVVTRNARMAFDQNGITKLVRAVAMLAERLGNPV